MPGLAITHAHHFFFGTRTCFQRCFNKIAYIVHLWLIGTVHKMTDNMFTIEASQLAVGNVLARGSPGITLYEADLTLAGRTTKVGL